MGRWSSIAIVSSLLIGINYLTGCTEEDPGTTASPSPSPGSPTAAAPSPATSPAAPAPTGSPVASPGATPPGKEADFPNPTVPQGQVAGGLTLSTNPNERARIARATKPRNDPFALVPIPPERIPQPKPSPGVRGTGGLPGGVTPGSAPTRPNVRPSPTRPSIAILPPLPEPELAKAVIVSGLVEVNGTVQVIVQAPNEDSPRYVQVGQRVSNGQVLVKRVDMSGEPAVILEQFGVEVRKPLGEQTADVAPPAPAAPGATPSPAPSVPTVTPPVQRII